MRLATSRLDLRLVKHADRDTLHGLEQDPEVMRYLNGGAPTPLEPIDAAKAPYRMPRGDDRDVWAVLVRQTGSFAGWVALHVDGDTGELGYRFFRVAWGQGYATEASRALVTFAFEQSGLVRITAQTMAANMRSRRVMEKLGMRHTRTWLTDLSDPALGDKDVEYVIERQDWGR